MSLAGLLSARDIAASSRLLEQRDRRALLFYGVSGLVIVLGSEAAVFHFDLANQYGYLPMLTRGVLYLLLTTLLWASLLRSNRHAITALLEEKQDFYESLLLAHDNALSLKDSYTGGHGRRVARYAHLIAGALGLKEEDADLVREAARLHDIGKIGIPDQILHKPGPLSARELATMRQHTVIGHRMLSDSPSRYLQIGAVIALGHHEKFDGSGYPYRLAGDAIPMPARIVAVADVFDALISKRPYKEPWPLEHALEYIKAQAGRHFDPDCAQAFLRRLDGIRQIMREYSDGVHHDLA